MMDWGYALPKQVRMNTCNECGRLCKANNGASLRLHMYACPVLRELDDIVKREAASRPRKRKREESLQVADDEDEGSEEEDSEE